MQSRARERAQSKPELAQQGTAPLSNSLAPQGEAAHCSRAELPRRDWWPSATLPPPEPETSATRPQASLVTADPAARRGRVQRKQTSSCQTGVTTGFPGKGLHDLRETLANTFALVLLSKASLFDCLCPSSCLQAG